MASEKYYIRLAMFASMIDAVQAQGITLNQLLRGTSAAALSSEDQLQVLLSKEEQLRFFKNLSTHCDLKTLSFVSGLRADFKALGIFGLAMLSAPKLADSIAIGARFAQVGGTIGTLEIRRSNYGLGLLVKLPVLPSALIRFLTEEQFSALISYSRVILGEEDTQLAECISFAYPEPENLSTYQECFKCKLIFDAPESIFWYRTEVINYSPVLANETASAMCSILCETELKKLMETPSIIIEVEGHLLANIQDMPSLSKLAEIMNLSERRLRSQLEKLGLSYQQVVINLRHSLASDWLRDDDYTIQQIGEMLGYSEHTNFRRAFKRWEGVSPRQYRVNSNQ